MKKFFALEKKRQKLAIENNLVELKKLYGYELPHLPDLNSSQLWDKLNSQHNSSPSFSPMEYDKLQKAAGWIRGINASILNIGFGSANLEKIFFSREQDTVIWEGIDISEASTRKAKELFPKGSFKKGDILNLKYKPGEFDYVVALEVLEHIQPHNILTVLKSIKRILKKDGRFILSVPINEGLEEMVKRGENPNAHLRDYTVGLIKAELELAGFAVMSSQTFYAFNSLYRLKTIIAKLFPFLKQVNGVLIVATPV